MIDKVVVHPLAATMNFFSVTALLIIAGLLGRAELAAEIAIIQAAIVAIFLSLSGNSRNMLLASDSRALEKSLFYFRLMVVLPAVVAIFYLTKISVDVSAYLTIGFLVRKCLEWFVELQLASKEKSDDFIFAFRYCLINTIAFLLLVLTLIIPAWMDYFLLTLYLWAIIPAIFLVSYIKWVLGLKQFKVSFSKFIPHIGSSTIVGISTYVFRVLVIILAGKIIAGQMFAAYAIGGVIASLYTYAIGPTLMHRKNADDKNILFVVVIFSICSGVLIILSTLFLDINLYSPLFLYGIGYSLIGGGVMLVAQRQRLYFLQISKKDVFVPDALVNILLISSIPFLYYVFGENSFATFFLWSAVLNGVFYILLAYKNRIGCL